VRIAMAQQWEDTPSRSGGHTFPQWEDTPSLPPGSEPGMSPPVRYVPPGRNVPPCQVCPPFERRYTADSANKLGPNPRSTLPPWSLER